MAYATCPNAELCRKMKRHLHGRRWHIWRGEDDEGHPVLTSQECEEYRVKWANAVGIDLTAIRQLNAPAQPTRCIHRGQAIEQIRCRTCMGGGSRPVFQCAIHGRCTDRNVTPKNPRTPKPIACSTCDDFCES